MRLFAASRVEYCVKYHYKSGKYGIMITIDGSQKSGSGTIVRDAVPFAVLAGEALHLINIRARRDKPGLRAQHVKGIEAAVQICGGHLEGGEIGSREIRFLPGTHLWGGTFNWDIGTAGSTTMLALSVIPLGLFADEPSRYRITGGLFQDFAPSVYHVQHVLLPILKRMGTNITMRIIRPGYVPRGNGHIDVRVPPLQQPLQPIKLLDRGQLLYIHGVALSSLLQDRKVSERMAGACRKKLKTRGYDATIEIHTDSKEQPVYDKASIQAGASLAIWAVTDTGCVIGSDMAGARGRPAELIGKQVASRLFGVLDTTATVDEHTADQIIPFAALADGVSSYIIPKMTDHIEARLWLAEKFFGAKTEVRNNIIRITGIGYRP
jgi:RNA 3'-terminal phosphate cyclase (ATP)